MSPPRPPPVAPGLYLVVRLAEERYALPALAVRELIRLPDVTPLPGAAPELRGVVNLRGRILPLYDLAACLGLARAALASHSVVVVVQDEGAGQLGFLVDEVVETRQLAARQIEAVSVPGKGAGADLSPAAANLDARVVFLIALDRVLAAHARQQEQPTGGPA